MRTLHVGQGICRLNLGGRRASSMHTLHAGQGTCRLSPDWHQVRNMLILHVGQGTRSLSPVRRVGRGKHLLARITITLHPQ